MLRIEQLAKLLSSSVGERAAREALTGAAVKLRLGPDEFTTDDALALFEVVAKAPGVLGISARFAKSRLHLLES